MRAAQRRRRRVRRLVGSSAAFVVVLGGVTGATFLRSDNSAGPRQVAASPSSTSTTTTTPPTTTPPPPPGATVATTNVPELAVYSAPSDTAGQMTTFSDKTEYGIVRTLLVTDQKTPGWLQVLLPLKPNGQTGWIHAGDVTLSQVLHRIEVDRASHTLRLFHADQLVLETPVAVGTPNTPTPTGTFYITDPVPGGGGAYGPLALGLSGYSDVLDSFAGGPPQIAIHGTNHPELIGQDVSNGCVRVPNDMIVQIGDQVPLGTPVIIT
jgi:lipoprotein-anchoring transpeptidase ErfK/SrfK